MREQEKAHKRTVQVDASRVAEEQAAVDELCNPPPHLLHMDVDGVILMLILNIEGFISTIGAIPTNRLIGTLKATSSCCTDLTSSGLPQLVHKSSITDESCCSVREAYIKAYKHRREAVQSAGRYGCSQRDQITHHQFLTIKSSTVTAKQ
jgi:hypothetical protein